jgi:hypothetical protein
MLSCAGACVDLHGGWGPARRPTGGCRARASGRLAVPLNPFLRPLCARTRQRCKAIHGIPIPQPAPLPARTQACGQLHATLPYSLRFPHPQVHTTVLNPKALTLGQLYGQFDADTHEWTDGVLPVCMRSAAADTRPDKQVHSLWPQSSGTVCGMASCHADVP